MILGLIQPIVNTCMTEGFSIRYVNILPCQYVFVSQDTRITRQYSLSKLNILSSSNRKMVNKLV